MLAIFQFSALKFFSLFGLIASILVLIPNFAYVKIGHQGRTNDVATCGAGVCMLELTTRGLLTVLLILLRMPMQHMAFGIAAGVVLFLYYVQWIRYYKNGSYYPDIYTKTFLGLPVPFAVLNSLYLILVSLWLGNGPALVCALIFAICHLMNARVARKDFRTRL